LESKKKLQLIGVFEREKTVQYSLTLECIRQTATAFNEAFKNKIIQKKFNTIVKIPHTNM
jgi:hypothetical protein